MRTLLFSLWSFALVRLSVPAQKLSSEPGKPEHRADVEVIGHVVKPLELPAPDVKALRVPAGFRIEKFAENLGNARVLAIGPGGQVYVSRREPADVLMLKVGPNGLSSGPPVRIAGRAGLHGIAFAKNRVYLATVHEVFTGEVLASGEFGPLQMIIKDQAFVIEIADEEAKVQRGLMYRKNMDASHGMLFVFDKPDTYSFWMKNTLIPLDIIYIDAKGKVLEIHDRKPLDETGKSPEMPALFVLELNAGRSKTIGLKPGDTVAIPEKYLKKTPASTDK